MRLSRAAVAASVAAVFVAGLLAATPQSAEARYYGGYRYGHYGHRHLYSGGHRYRHHGLHGHLHRGGHHFRHHGHRYRYLGGHHSGRAYRGLYGYGHGWR